MRHEHKPLYGTDHHNHREEDGVHAHVAGVENPRAHRPEEKRRLLFAIAVTASAMIVEIVGGYVSGSLALISDAGHMLTHTAALAVSVLAIRIAAVPTKPERSFGMYRVEVLAALLNAVTLFVITIFIAREAWERFQDPRPILAWEMFGVAVFGLAVNLLTAYILHGAGHDDLNFRSAFLHMVGDTLSSVAVVAGALAIRFTGFLWIDPLLSVLICLVILYWAWGLLRESVHILMESAPRGFSVEEVRRAVVDRFEVVRDAYDIHAWTITGGMHAMTAYLELKREMSLAGQSELAHDLRHFVADRFGVSHAVFQFVPAGEE